MANVWWNNKKKKIAAAIAPIAIVIVPIEFRLIISFSIVRSKVIVSRKNANKCMPNSHTSNTLNNKNLKLITRKPLPYNFRNKKKRHFHFGAKSFSINRLKSCCSKPQPMGCLLFFLHSSIVFVCFETNNNNKKIHYLHLTINRLWGFIHIVVSHFIKIKPQLKSIRR